MLSGANAFEISDCGRANLWFRENVIAGEELKNQQCPVVGAYEDKACKHC
jgi:hypothetical protein